MNPQPTIEVMSRAAQVLSSGDVREKLRVLAEVQNAVDAAQAVLLVEPLLLSLGGLAAAFIAVATFLPIMKLVSNLG